MVVMSRWLAVGSKNIFLIVPTSLTFFGISTSKCVRPMHQQLLVPKTDGSVFTGKVPSTSCGLWRSIRNNLLEARARMMTLLATWTATKSEAIWNSRATRSRLKIGRSAEKSGILEEDATKAPKPYEGSNEAAITSGDVTKHFSLCLLTCSSFS